MPTSKKEADDALIAIRQLLSAEDGAVIDMIAKVYGGDVSTILSRLHFVASVVAVTSGVEADDFAEGVKQAWDRVALAVNETQGTS